MYFCQHHSGELSDEPGRYSYNQVHRFCSHYCAPTAASTYCKQMRAHVAKSSRKLLVRAVLGRGIIIFQLKCFDGINDQSFKARGPMTAHCDGVSDPPPQASCHLRSSSQPRRQAEIENRLV